MSPNPRDISNATSASPASSPLSSPVSSPNPFELLLQASESETQQNLNLASQPGIQKDFFVKLPSNLFQHFKTGDLLSLKCRNRECSSLRGYPKKPNSIYCSARCQSRGKIFLFFFLVKFFTYFLFFLEQNLRQGRVKNVKLLPPIAPISKTTVVGRKNKSLEKEQTQSLEKLNINFLISHNEPLSSPEPTDFVWQVVPNPRPSIAI